MAGPNSTANSLSGISAEGIEEMEELKQAIVDAAMLADDPQSEKLYPELQEAAEKWAIHSCRCYQGESLNRALTISRAIVDFIEEISRDV